MTDRLRFPCRRTCNFRRLGQPVASYHEVHVNPEDLLSRLGSPVKPETAVETKASRWGTKAVGDAHVRRSIPRGKVLLSRPLLLPRSRVTLNEHTSLVKNGPSTLRQHTSVHFFFHGCDQAAVILLIQTASVSMQEA